MARTKEFDRDQALAKAMGVFWQKGYSATSTDDLLKGMRIGRQSMYDTFGDKHSLYLEALDRYGRTVMTEVFHTDGDALQSLRNVLISISEESDERRRLGCMGVNSVTEFGLQDKEIHKLRVKAGANCKTALIHMIERAQSRGQIKKNLDPSQTADYILMVRTGLRVNAKGGASRESLRDIAEFSLQTLMP